MQMNFSKKWRQTKLKQINNAYFLIQSGQSLHSFKTFFFFFKYTWHHKMIALGKSLFLVVEQAMNKIVNLKSHFGELG